MKKIKLLKQQIAACDDALKQDYQQLTQIKTLAAQGFQHDTKNLYPWLTAAAFIVGFACAISPRARRSVVTTFKYSFTTLLNNKLLLESLITMLTLK